MKVFISSDIEGVNGMTDWVEAEKGRPEYGMFVQRQDRALAAISEGLHDSDPGGYSDQGRTWDGLQCDP